MDDRSANLLQHSDLTADAFITVGASNQSLFVINLCAANVPQAIDAGSVQAWGIAGLGRYRLYQVSRMEDGRRRYRVRLGFFTSEADAELVLQTVRGRFATAFSSCLADEDLKHASGYLKKPLHEIQEIQDLQRTGRYKLAKFTDEEDVSRPAGKTVEAKKSTPASTPVTPIARGPAPKPTQPSANAGRTAKEDSIVEFEWAPPRKAAAPSKTAPNPRQAQLAKIKAALNANIAAKLDSPPAKLALATKPVAAQTKVVPQEGSQYHVGAGRNIPDFGLSLTSDPPPASRAQAPAARPTTEAKTPAPAAAPASQQATPDLPRPLVSAEALAKLRAAAQPRQQAAVIPTLDSTQTIRTLTKNEKEDENAPKWFVVQLAVSDQPANLDTMPRLDIFEAYRLYSIAAVDGAVIRHTLRLGFFSEQVSAEAVMGYLKTFFNDPRIERVSDAEQKRFAQAPIQKVAATEGPKPHSQVITLEEKRGPHAVEIAHPAPAAPIPAPVNRSASKFAAPAIKRAAPAAKKTNGKGAAKSGTTGKYAHLSVEERTAIREARLLGLSETAIRRVEGNSLLSRLVGKLTK